MAGTLWWSGCLPTLFAFHRVDPALTRRRAAVASSIGRRVLGRQQALTDHPVQVAGHRRADLAGAARALAVGRRHPHAAPRAARPRCRSRRRRAPGRGRRRRTGAPGRPRRRPRGRSPGRAPSSRSADGGGWQLGRRGRADSGRIPLRDARGGERERDAVVGQPDGVVGQHDDVVGVDRGRASRRCRAALRPLPPPVAAAARAGSGPARRRRAALRSGRPGTHSRTRYATRSSPTLRLVGVVGRRDGAVVGAARGGGGGAAAPPGRRRPSPGPSTTTRTATGRERVRSSALPEPGAGRREVTGDEPPEAVAVFPGRCRP